MKKITIFAVSLITLTLILTQSSLACDCVERTTSESYDSADAVFIGKVVQSDSSDPSLQVTFEVESLLKFKGLLQGEPRDKISIASHGTDCDYRFEQNGIFMVYAHKYNGQLYVGSCSGTRLLNTTRQPNLEKALAELATTNRAQRKWVIAAVGGWSGLIIIATVFLVMRNRKLQGEAKRSKR